MLWWVLSGLAIVLLTKMYTSRAILKMRAKIHELRSDLRGIKNKHRTAVERQTEAEDGLERMELRIRNMEEFINDLQHQTGNG